MRRLGYIRLLTYALLLAYLLFARERRYVLPVRLQGPEVAYEEEAAEFRREQLIALLARPGFGETRMSGISLMRAANEYAAKEKTDLRAYRPPIFSLTSQNGRLKWILHFEQNLNPLVPGGFFDLTIDDVTGEIEVSPGM